MVLAVSVTISLSPALEAAISAGLATSNSALARIESKLDAAIAKEQIEMSVLDTDLAALTAQVNSNTSVIASAEEVIEGIAAQIAAAVAAALAAGATAAQLKSITDLQATVAANDTALAAAIANTSGGGQPVAP